MFVNFSKVIMIMANCFDEHCVVKDAPEYKVLVEKFEKDPQKRFSNLASFVGAALRCQC